MENLPKRAEDVSCANYVLNIYEYTNVIEEDTGIPGRGIDK